jgi:hypothetical protein
MFLSVIALEKKITQEIDNVYVYYDIREAYHLEKKDNEKFEALRRPLFM